MTGPGEGKIRLNAQVYLNGESLENVDVYIHVKGYSLARVTHLDIEHPRINDFVSPHLGAFLKVIGVKNGLMIRGRSWNLIVKSPLLSDLLMIGEGTYAWVGGKIGGLYIGFKKKYIEKLEDKVIKLFNVIPR